jgi:hypothetical protein
MSDRHRWHLTWTWWLFAVLLLLAGILSSSLAALTIEPEGKKFAAMGLALGTSIASLGIGALFGFLFGIPRSLTGAQSETAAATRGSEQTSGSYGGNTNLEQISDWLTKILVGVGLVELGNLAPQIGNLASWLALSMGDGNSPAPFFSQLFGVDMVYFSILGFVWSYLGTRIYLPRAFTEAEDLREKVAALGEKIEDLERQRSADSVAIYEACTRLTGDPKSSPADLKTWLRRASVGARYNVLLLGQYERLHAAGPAKVRTLHSARHIFEALVQTIDTGNSRDEREYLHQYFANLAYTYKDDEPAKFDTAVNYLDRAIELRNTLPNVDKEGLPDWYWYEIDRAICRVASELQRREAVSDEVARQITNDLELINRGQSHLYEANFLDPQLSSARGWLIDRRYQILNLQDAE